MLFIYLSMLDTEEEKAVFEEIYEEYKFDCLHVAMCVTKNKTIAEDAVHNAFMEIIKRKDEFFQIPCGKRRSRIVIIVKNKAIDLLRKESHESYVQLEQSDDSIPSINLDLSAAYEEKESLEYLMDCVALLPDIYKTVFELRFSHELGNSEIAKILNITPRAVSMRIHRAKLMLQEIIEKGGDDSER